MKYFKRDGKIYVQCIDGEMEVSDNHYEILKNSKKYLEKAVDYSKGKIWTINIVPKELDTKINIVRFLEDLKEVIENWHRKEQNRDYLEWFNEQIHILDMAISDPLLDKDKKEDAKKIQSLEYLLKGLKGIRDFGEKLPLPSIGSVNGLNCLEKFKEVDLKFIHSKLIEFRKLNRSVTQTNFVGAFQGAILPGKIKWIGNNTELATLVHELTGETPEPLLINSLFETKTKYDSVSTNRINHPNIIEMVKVALK
jgi:hypothetical protein